MFKLTFKCFYFATSNLFQIILSGRKLKNCHLSTFSLGINHMSWLSFAIVQSISLGRFWNHIVIGAHLRNWGFSFLKLKKAIVLFSWLPVRIPSQAGCQNHLFIQRLPIGPGIGCWGYYGIPLQSPASLNSKVKNLPVCSLALTIPVSTFQRGLMK